MTLKDAKKHRPLLVVVAAPSGAGKSTLCKRLLAERPEFVYSVSCTTRAPRGAEQNGVAYFFLSIEEFEARLANNEFLEHACVHGHYYGTLRKTISEAMSAGRSVILDIDVAGAAQVRNLIAQLSETDPMRRGFVDIFINAPSLEVLRDRLIKRGENSLETIEKRLVNAAGEIARAHEFSHRLINADLEETYPKFRQIILDATLSD